MTIPYSQRADYYSTLDSVRFNSAKVDSAALHFNEVDATGTIMLGLLVGDTRPVLTQAQAIDSRYVLGVLERQDRDTSGFLKLVQEGAIRVGFNDNPPLLAAENRFTLLNAFASALARKEDFLLSGWPELNSRYGLRKELARIVSSAGSGSALSGRQEVVLVNEVEHTAGPVIAQRFKGLLLMSRALATAGPPDRTTEFAPGAFRNGVVTVLTAFASRQPDAVEPIQWLLGHTPERLASTAPELDNRSSWFELIDIYRQRHPSRGLLLDAIERQVNYATHKHISRSLRATGDEVNVGGHLEAESIASGSADDDIPVSRLVALSRDAERAKWMTWSEVPTLWQELQTNSVGPADRLERLIDRHKDEIFTRKLADTSLLEIKIAVSLPTIGVTVAAGAADNLLSNGLSGVAGAATGAAVGTLMVVAGTRRAIKSSSRIQSYLKRRSDRRWEASVNAGTASWQNQLGS